MSYEKLIQNKTIQDNPSGFECDNLSPVLFDFQAVIVKWALSRGRAAIFADTGLGKTFMQCEWAQKVHEHTGGDILIVAPLCVAQQTVEEAKAINVDVHYCREQAKVKKGINITNYEMLAHFDLSEFVGVVLDESSILKSHSGKTRTALIEQCQVVDYRLSCTATPSPNDFMELGNQAEFLGVMTRTEMLAMFFAHDGGDTSKWRLKGWGATRFWEWMSKWAVVIRKPSDLGFDDARYELPELKIKEHVIADEFTEEGQLFATIATTLSERRRAQRQSIDERVAAVAEHTKSMFCDKLAEIIRDNYYGMETGIRGHEKREGASRPRIQGEAKDSGCSEGQNSQKIVHEKICPTESREVQTVPGAKSKEQPSEEGKVCREQKTQGRVEEKDKRVASGEPREAEGAENKEIRNDDGLLQLSNESSESQMSDMRPFRPIEQEHVSIDRPLSFYRSSARRALYELQSGTWEVSGFNETIGSRDFVLKQLQKVIIWCHLNDEQDALAKEFKGLCVSVTGSDSIDKKEKGGREFTFGVTPIIISKPKIFGHGLNWQHCNKQAFVGLSDSFEQFYQAVRRSWRFGQTKPVTVEVFTAESEGQVLANIRRKEAQHNEMSDEMVNHMRELTKKEVLKSERDVVVYERDHASGDNWDLHQADCVHLASEIESDSVDYTIFSPPFASLYTYSNSDYDMGNCKDDQGFYDQFEHLVKEMFRITKPGRNLSFHCMNLPTSKQNHGYIGLRDFRGEMIRLFLKHGWIFHSEVCIWKDPVIAMQRTKALGLLWKQVRKDAAMSRQGIPDYLVTLRKPGDNPNPVEHSHENLPVALWQKYASPVWTDINPSRTLNKMPARDDNDERHICPLQLDVIERALHLWTNPGDLVFSPFTGIGSEGYCSLQMKRRFIGSELKPSYFAIAKENLTDATTGTADLFAQYDDVVGA